MATTTELAPMLATKTPTDEKFKFPVMVSPTIDGIRVLVRDGVAYSRTLKPIPNKYVQSVLGHASLNGLDGELVIGPPNAKDAMQRAQGIMRIEGEPDFTWYVFDDFTNPALQYHVRFRLAGLRVEDLGLKRVKCLGHSVAKSQEDLDQMEAIALRAGFEGLMVRAPEGPYKYGRATAKEGYLCKVKRFLDAEAEVIGYEERMHNDNEATTDELGRTKRATVQENLRPAGDLGALVCQLLDQGGARVFVEAEDGKLEAVTFNIGTGFTQAQREELWAERDALEGRIAKFKYFAASGVKVAPRFPVFLGWRDRSDL